MEEQNNKQVKLDIGEQLNHAFEIYKKIALISGLAILTMYLIILILTFIGIGFFFNLEEFPEVMKDLNSGKLGLNGKIIYLSFIVLFITLISPFLAGILKMARDADNNEEVEFTSIFTYINSPQFIHIITATALILILSNGLNLLTEFLLPSPLGTFIGFIVSLTISIFTYLMIPLIIFKHLSFIDAIKTSISQISSNFFFAVILMFIAFVFSMVGLIAFCIGVVFTLPFFFAVRYSVYKKLN